MSAVARNGASIISVGATSGMLDMSTSPSNAASSRRGPVMTVESDWRCTEAPSFSHSAKKP